MNFWIKTNYFVKKIFPNYVWSIPNNEKKVYLTFDDGPTPEITAWTLEQLKKHNAKATFFCIGKNIQEHPEIFKRILIEGHAVGNHTFDHLKGWKTPTESYLKNVALCQSEMANQNLHIATLFRPPYGKIKASQSKEIRQMGYKIIMWDIISEDYDQQVSRKKCLENVTKNIESGSIIVFHDSIKAFQNLEFALPKTLEFLSKNGFVYEKLD